VVLSGPDSGKEFTTTGVLEAAPPLGPMATYVWDVDGTTRFHVIGRRYGRDPDKGGVPPARPYEAPHGLFRLPEGFYHEVDAQFPERWHQERVLEMLWCERFVATGGKPQPPMGPGGNARRRGSSRPANQVEENPFPPVDPSGGEKR
jgi:hypothetical protein